LGGGNAGLSVQKKIEAEFTVKENAETFQVFLAGGFVKYNTALDSAPAVEVLFPDGRTMELDGLILPWNIDFEDQNIAVFDPAVDDELDTSVGNIDAVRVIPDGFFFFDPVVDEGVVFMPRFAPVAFARRGK